MKKNLLTRLGTLALAALLCASLALPALADSNINDDYMLACGDSKHSYAIGFLGSIPDDEVDAVLDEYTEINFGDADTLIDCGGEQLYVIVPRYAADKVVVKTLKGPNTDGKMVVKKMIYSGTGTIFLRCNPSELHSNVWVTVGKANSFSPKLSLKTGNPLFPKAAHDITGIILAAGEGNDFTTVLANVRYQNSSEVLIDDLLWIDGSDTRTLTRYGIPPEEVTNDYAIVNIGDEKYHSYAMDEVGSFSTLIYDEASDNGYRRDYSARNAFVKKLKAYCVQYEGAAMTANVTLDGNTVIAIDEVFVP